MQVLPFPCTDHVCGILESGVCSAFELYRSHLRDPTVGIKVPVCKLASFRELAIGPLFDSRYHVGFIIQITLPFVCWSSCFQILVLSPT